MSRSAWPRRAASDLPESTHGTVGSSATGRPVAEVSSGPGAGGCSRMVWAFVPLTPNDETAARRGRPSSGHGRASVSNSRSPAAQSTCGVGSSMCSVRGSTPCRIAMIILMMPATPAAACVWPMLDFSEPSHSGCPSGRSRP